MKQALIALCLTAAVACERHEPQVEAPKAARTAPAAASQPAPLLDRSPPPAPAPATAKKLFLDVHDVGPGKLTAKAVAEAHQKDLAAQGAYGVDYQAYWFDEKQGKVYCLAEAPSAEAAIAVHEKAHGLLPTKISEVTPDNRSWSPDPGTALCLDVHHLEPGKVTAKAVAAAHTKDLAVQSKHGAKYLNYWFDETTGTVMCLVQAPSAAAAIAVHKEAHGLIPESIERVSEGR